MPEGAHEGALRRFGAPRAAHYVGVPRHELASAFADVAASVYDRGRAPYDREVLAAFGLPAGARVLDLGAGTGLLSTALLAAGHDVVAVEASVAMHARLVEKLPDALLACAEALPLDDACVDAVVCGDAWHWFDPDAAAREVHRVLRPGGLLVLVWRERKEPALPGALNQRIDALRTGAHPAFVGEQGREGLIRHGGFAPLEQVDVPFVHRTDRAGVLALMSSWSFVARLPQDERAALLDDAAATLPDGPVERPTVAHVWRTVRQPSDSR